MMKMMVSGCECECTGRRRTEDVLERLAADATVDEGVEGGDDGAGVDGVAHPTELACGLFCTERGGEAGEHGSQADWGVSV